MENKGNNLLQYHPVECLVDSMKLPKTLSLKDIPEKRRPIFEDWKELQGGMPNIIFVCEGRFDVDHYYMKGSKDFPNKGPVVPTHGEMLRDDFPNPRISRFMGGRWVDFPTALVYARHGKPCKQRSDEWGSHR